MTPDTFFDNFALLIDAPNAVAKLREIVLQLAVRGKLTTQNSTDEPASVLVEKSRIERDNFISNSKIRKSNLMPPIKENEIPYQLPQAWEWSRFNDIVFSQEGPGIRNWQFRDTGVKLLNVKNIVKGKLVLENSDKHISEEEFNQKYSHFLIEDGDLLFASSENSWGKTAFFKNPGYRVIVNTSTIRMRFWLKECNNNYLRYFLDCNIFTNQMLTQLQGMQPNFGSSHLVKVFLPLPPLAEQKRIVEKCDRLLILCDEIEKRQQQRQASLLKMNEGAISQLLTAQNPDDFQHHWQRICNNFDLLYSIPETIPKLRQAILQLAIQGKLVSQTPSDEPASALLERLNNLKQPVNGKRNKKIEPALPIDSKHVPFEVPEGWSWTRFQEVATIASNLVKPESFLDLPHIAPDNIEKQTGKLLPYQTVREDEVRSNNHYFFRNQILYSKIRPNLAKVVIVDFDGLCSADMYPINAHVDSRFLLRYMLSQTFLSMSVKSDTRVAMPKINQDELNKILVPVPPLAEQKRIVAKVDSLLSLCDALEVKLKAARDSSSTLMEVAARQVLAV